MCTGKDLVASVLTNYGSGLGDLTRLCAEISVNLRCPQLAFHLYWPDSQNLNEESVLSSEKNDPKFSIQLIE